MNFLKHFFCVLLLSLILAPKAYAYLDPGTASYFLQAIVAALIGGSYLMATSWRKVKTFLTGLFSKQPKSKKENEQ